MAIQEIHDEITTWSTREYQIPCRFPHQNSKKYPITTTRALLYTVVYLRVPDKFSGESKSDSWNSAEVELISTTEAVLKH